MSPRPLALGSAAALALRLAGQRLDRPAPHGSLVATCGAIGGAQAQVGSAARLALAARVSGLSAADYERALYEARTLVKTWTVRGTLHVIPSADLGLHVAAFGGIRIGQFERWLTRGGLDPRQSAAVTDDVVEALGAGPLTRREISARVAAAHGPVAKKWIEHSWGGVLRRGLYEGRVCFGPARGNEVRFVRTDQWLAGVAAAAAPAAAGLPAGAAEAELARRYVRAYGPATPRDFGFWAGLYVPDALRIWERIERELVPVTVEGRAAWIHEDILAKARRLARAPGGEPGDFTPVHLLAHFDPYLLGHRDKEAVVDRTRYKRVFRTAGWIAPVLLIGGRVAGTWEPARARGALVARLRPFGRPAPGVRAAARAALEPLAACEGLAPRLTWR
jgi:hypothetical protein